ncbi:PREDICTED: uncharacterized protein LOC109205461 [Nicotiana attenuata]|uniref:Late embryogenesis abundant protein n=1 Tax=Nicotiana attenuata TaxID=49451 RepID=A0A314KWS8_NICAT|nr:PREDICTED: uncharacterized protein LOC109205461 [Nicotiana attenuata]OIT33866.1 hypothetical protein A4A49_06623 [Nicotiana attenuata]
MPITAAGITTFPQRLRLIRSQQMHQIKRGMRAFISGRDEIWRNDEGEEEEEIKKGSTWWMPHPRTGIYFPVGQERVMDDIPNGAASLPQTYWLRSEDGVDKPDPDFPIAPHFTNYRHRY